MAVKAGHPTMFQLLLPPLLSECIAKSLSMSCPDRMFFRATALKFWLRGSIQLKNEEKAFSSTLEPGGAEALPGKRLLFWKEMRGAVQ